MINPIITQGYAFNNPGSFIVSQGYGLVDGSVAIPSGSPPPPVIVLDTGTIADYINQSIISVRNGRVTVGYQKRLYGTIIRGETNLKDGLNTKLAPQFGLAFDRYNLDYAGQQESVSQ